MLDTTRCHHPITIPVIGPANKRRNVDFWEFLWDDFLETLKHIESSAPGPDGYDYLFWIRAPLSIKTVLFQLVIHVINGGSVAEDFNHAIMVFIQKDKRAEDTRSFVSRTPKQTRTLSLSNTDAKIVAKCIFFLLNQNCMDILSKLGSSLRIILLTKAQQLWSH